MIDLPAPQIQFVWPEIIFSFFILQKLLHLLWFFVCIISVLIIQNRNWVTFIFTLPSLSLASDQILTISFLQRFSLSHCCSSGSRLLYLDRCIRLLITDPCCSSPVPLNPHPPHTFLSFLLPAKCSLNSLPWLPASSPSSWLPSFLHAFLLSFLLFWRNLPASTAHGNLYASGPRSNAVYLEDFPSLPSLSESCILLYSHSAS